MTRSGKRSGSRPVSFSRRCSLCKRPGSGDLMFFNVLSCMTSGLRLICAPAASKSSTDAPASLCGLLLAGHLAGLLAGCKNHLSSNCFNPIGTCSSRKHGIITPHTDSVSTIRTRFALDGAIANQPKIPPRGFCVKRQGHKKRPGAEPASRSLHVVFASCAISICSVPACRGLPLQHRYRRLVPPKGRSARHQAW